MPRMFLIVTLAFSLAIVLAEIFTAPPTADAHRALQWILKRPMGNWFWGVGIGVGHLLPLALLAVDSPFLNPIAALATLVGMYMIEKLWVLAPQYVPLS